jgi:hypothetical protein
VRGRLAKQGRLYSVQYVGQAGSAMSKALKVFSGFLKDENGAALIEYTVLLIPDDVAHQNEMMSPVVTE